MKRRRRAALSVAGLASAAAAVWLLIALSDVGEGPLATTLDRLGSMLDSVEHYARERLHGPGRRQDLRWFEAQRSSVERLRHPDAVLLGAYTGQTDVLDRVVTFERRIETTLPLIHLYGAWGDQPEHLFPERIVTTVWNMGSIAVITWEPWLTVFDNPRHPFLPLRELRDQHGLAAVARGEYDFYVDRWATAAARFERPIFVRFGHEMNDPYRYPWGPQHNTKEEFIAAWRHVVDRFRRAGATNVLWVWSPHLAYEYWDLYFPGSDYVDWVAAGVLNFGPIAQWSRWWTFDDILASKYPRLAGFGKPIMIAEFGSLGVGGDRERWYRDALHGLPTKYPGIRSVMFFHTPVDQTVTYQQVDWTVTSDDALSTAIAEAIRPLVPSK